MGLGKEKQKFLSLQVALGWRNAGEAQALQNLSQ